MPLAFITAHPSKKNLTRKPQPVLALLFVACFTVLIPAAADKKHTALQRINPWLSACDLVQAAPPDLLGTCSTTQLPLGAVAKHPLTQNNWHRRTREPTVPPIPSPNPVPDDNDLTQCPEACPYLSDLSPLGHSKKPQCLYYLRDDDKKIVCNTLTNYDKSKRKGWILSQLKTLRFRHCCEYTLYEALSTSLLNKMSDTAAPCREVLDSLIELDNLAARITCEFTEVLSRFDCGQPYSVRFTCEHCKEAYRRWVCTSLMPYFVDLEDNIQGRTERRRVRPCRVNCRLVEQRCPYFLPGDRAPAYPTQYAGEPTFLCIDPNIPETGEQLKKSLYTEEETCCFQSRGYFDGLQVINDNCTHDKRLTKFDKAAADAVDCNNQNEVSGFRVPHSSCPALPSSPHNLHSGYNKLNPPKYLILLFQLFLLTNYLTSPVIVKFILYKMQYINWFLYKKKKKRKRKKKKKWRRRKQLKIQPFITPGLVCELNTCELCRQSLNFNTLKLFIKNAQILWKARTRTNFKIQLVHNTACLTIQFSLLPLIYLKISTISYKYKIINKINY